MALSSATSWQGQSLQRDTPMPTDEADAEPVFQAWHEYDAVTKYWERVDIASRTSDPRGVQPRPTQNSKLVLTTWNVDAFADEPEQRIAGIISHIKGLSLAADIISHIQGLPLAADIVFLQEVSQDALAWLMKDTWIRESWFSSEADTTNWQGVPFATMTLLSRSRFGYGKEEGVAQLGPVWRVNYPSRFARDALCCDVFIPTSPSPTSYGSASSALASLATRVRLVNVHLDSLQMRPSHRPRQLAIIAAILRSAGRGLVAGDFNPVLPEDETLVKDNDLVDAWIELHPREPGFTWGIDGKAPFPPGRLDKVAMLGLKPQDMDVIHPGAVMVSGGGRRNRRQYLTMSLREQQGKDTSEEIPWSDHSGLNCSFELLSDWRTPTRRATSDPSKH